ncbi:zinc finger, CCHC-type containing protein [Tanacetum coccineum]|uniref:Zinc finger, CCHC-type containing protein n=1 Tax=Tanacetum coccineum TaxID=301880 RepID=A0ABQ5ASP5_9ASTR
MLKENRLGLGNVKLEGREWTKNDIKRSEVMLEMIDKKLKHRELMQLRGGLILVPQLMFVKSVDGLRHMNWWKTNMFFTWVMIISLLFMEKEVWRIIHETMAPYTPQQNDMAKRKNRALKEMVNAMLSYSGLSDGFYVIEPNDSVSINIIIESRDAIFDENCFSTIPRPKVILPNSDESQRDDHSNDVSSETPVPRKSKRARKAKLYGCDFQLYLVEGSRDQIGSQYSCYYSIEEDLRTYNEAMKSQDVAFWKEAIDDEIGSIMENNTWVLSDLPLGCKPLAILNLVIHQMDVKTTILNGDLEEEGYMKKTGGFGMPGNEHKVCKPIKSLYGLKQALK